MEALQMEASLAFAGEGDWRIAAMLTAALWLAGACVSSFAGLVATRIGSVPEGASVLRAACWPASRCDGCGRNLSALDLVPVLGWLVARGRCRDCGARVHWAYPVSEAAVGTLTAAFPWAAGGLEGPAIWGILALWIATLGAWIDAVEHVIPEEITWVLLFAGLLVSPFGETTWNLAAAAAVCGGGMWASLSAVGWVKGLDTRAGGDVAMAAACGAWTGTAGAPAFLLLSSAAFVAYALPARMRGVAWVPMGPSMCVGLAFAALAAAAGMLPGG